jgi:hypothetical protein
MHAIDSMVHAHNRTCRVLQTFLSSPRPLLLLQPFQLIASQELTFGCFMWAQPSCLFLPLSRHSVSLEFVVCPCLCWLKTSQLTSQVIAMYDSRHLNSRVFLIQVRLLYVPSSAITLCTIPLLLQCLNNSAKPIWQ